MSYRVIEGKEDYSKELAEGRVEVPRCCLVCDVVGCKQRIAAMEWEAHVSDFRNYCGGKDFVLKRELVERGSCKCKE